jgi:DNA-binding transcriptional LysR family regulator
MEPQLLSFQIKQLEREIGFALFSHRENRTHLTAAGAAFLANVEVVLASADRAVEHGARVARGESGLLRIGSASPIVHAFLAPAIRSPDRRRSPGAISTAGTRSRLSTVVPITSAA